MDRFKIIMLVLLGVAVAVGVFCLATTISCSVNGITFSEQIVEWFTTSTPVIEEVVEIVEDTIV